MNAEVLDIEISGLVLSGDDPSLFRDRRGRPRARGPNFDEGYDFRTLVYGAFEDAENDCVCVLCPPLLNFRALIEETEFQLDGIPAHPRAILDLSRCSVLLFDYVDALPASISLTHRLFGGTVPILPSLVSRFEGSNAIYAISKNNDLQWIGDWLTYYVRAHGLTSAVLIDNGSTDYRPEDLRKTVASVNGLKRAAVLRARYPFGPTVESTAGYASLYLQRSMIELVRRHLLARARAVMNADIDELIWSRTGQSVFDATVEEPDGYLRAGAVWVYAKDVPEGSGIRHMHHGMVSASGKPKSKRKWCVAPTGAKKGQQWLTHFMEDRRDPVHPDFLLWHFRDVTTGWKEERLAADRPELVPAPELQTEMRRVFGQDQDLPAASYPVTSREDARP
ncbi:MAG: hypothetical protein AAF667_05575 [Pseudomonadota bacterium]